MNSIANDNFMLKSPAGRRLYRDYARDLPVIDYHCHLDPRIIAEDRMFADPGELMLGADHYKWRAMRSFGIDERLITGDAPYRDKFRAYAEMLGYAIGNPLYAWTHLELKYYFGIDECLNADNADKIFGICEEKLHDPSFSAKGLIRRSGVEVLCTTDDPSDDLQWHKAIADSGFGTKVLPTFRPDRVLDARDPGFAKYIRAAGCAEYADLLSWLSSRISYFGVAGCRLSDHGFRAVPFRDGNPEKAFRKAMRGEPLSDEEAEAYSTSVFLHCAREYAAHGWAMQIHFGPSRNNNTVMFDSIGRDTGFDSIADTGSIGALTGLLDRLEQTDELPKTILYSLNPKDNYALAAMMGSFQKGPVRSKLQLGSGWWFNDQRDGMESQLRALGNLGILGCFIGMLTDSRSFISYPRHDYFRRILCNLIGGWVDDGEYPDDPKMLGKIVSGICYDNAKKYFEF